MQFDPIEILINALWASPLWVKVALMVAVVLRLGLTWLSAERATAPRTWRRRRRWRGWHDQW